MALTFVSREIPPPPGRSGAGMRSCVGGLQARRLYPSVDLRRAHRAVTQELLDRAQIGPAVQQMCRERVSQRVRRDAALDRSLARPRLEAAANVRCREPSPALGQEERLGAIRD